MRPHQEMAVLSLEEKKFLLGVERGDVAGTRRVMQRAKDTHHINVDCVDPLGRSALLMAIDNENLEMVELLLEFGVETRDALLHAISEEFVEAVEALLDHEERTRKPGEPNVSIPIYLRHGARLRVFLTESCLFPELGSITPGDGDVHVRHLTAHPGSPPR